MLASDGIAVRLAEPLIGEGPENVLPRQTRGTPFVGAKSTMYFGSSPTTASRVHSVTFPCMSQISHGLAVFLPTSCANSSPLLLELASHQAWASRSAGFSPKEYLVWVPARQAYSHSTSVGRSYWLVVVNLPAARSLAVNRRQNSAASSCVT